MPELDPEYLAWLRKRRCAFEGCKFRTPPCDPHHHTRGIQRIRGFGEKADDRDSFPLCRTHHDDFHAARGPFKGWDKKKRTEWQTNMCLEYRAMYEAMNEDAKEGL